MRRRRLREPRIFFPWEGKGGLVRRLGLGRVRPVLFGLAVVGVVAWVGVRERNRSGLRQTRATVLDARRAVDAYIAEHDGGCPPDLGAVARTSAAKAPPKDAWGRPLRLVCPGRREGSDYELMSDGPDGLPGGLDRID
ncbi:MAG: type II secretion system protein GspG [Polyangiaceae bacterium]|nr:type II secretion system protein GspG [Myxococcales bacterium]MCC6900204.1 type II secretion system protein GspG [Polyangiaceae bacterium]